jgi:uroporphyrinogen decarboxylase
MQPVDVIDVDAAILFSDLLVPFTPMGLDFDFVKGEGPSIERPIRSDRDVQRLRRFEPRQALAHVLETIRLLRRELEGRVPLIGFGGAPFTLAAYAIEGGPSTSYANTKTFMYAQPAAWHRLCEYFATVMTDYLEAQVEAGAQALQIFDSWAGALSRQDYREFVLPHSRQLLSGLADTGVPVVHFGVGTTAILREIAEAGGDVIGVDWRQPLDDAWSVIGCDRGIQGNLDPTLLLGPADRLLMAADDVLARAARRPGHVFNLGHGVLPTTPLSAVQELARHVHAATLA